LADPLAGHPVHLADLVEGASADPARLTHWIAVGQERAERIRWTREHQRSPAGRVRA
jgi:hypothetical protein